MGSASKVVLVVLRVWQLICSVVVLGILAAFLNRVHDASGPKDGRIVYSIVTASISTAFSIIFIAPFFYSFLAFPFDFVLFVMWLVVFCLLESVRSYLHCSPVPYPTELTLCPARRHPHMQLVVVYELLGILLGRVVETARLCQQHARQFRLQPVANRFGILLYGHVCLYW